MSGQEEEIFTHRRTSTGAARAFFCAQSATTLHALLLARPKVLFECGALGFASARQGGTDHADQSALEGPLPELITRRLGPFFQQDVREEALRFVGGSSVWEEEALPLRSEKASAGGGEEANGVASLPAASGSRKGSSQRERGGGSRLHRRDIPLLLPLQRCLGLGWVSPRGGSCLGVTRPGAVAAVFARVRLVESEGQDGREEDGEGEGESPSTPSTLIIAPAAEAPPNAISFQEDPSAAARQGCTGTEVRSSGGRASEASLLKEAPELEVGVASKEEAEESEGSSFFAALLLEEAQTEALQSLQGASRLAGEFTLLQLEENRKEEDSAADIEVSLQLCVGEKPPGTTLSSCEAKRNRCQAFLSISRPTQEKCSGVPPRRVSSVVEYGAPRATKCNSGRRR